MWPFSRREDWRDTEETSWVTVAQAGDYDCQLLSRKQVRFPDGATRWRVKQYGPFGPIEQMVKVRG